MLAVKLTFGINSGAYLAEIIRVCIMAIVIGQMEASRLMELSVATSMRIVILPQAIKNILPAIGNEFITLLKETSVIGYITVIDLTRVRNLVRARTLDPYFSLFFVAGVYQLLVICIIQLLKNWKGGYEGIIEVRNLYKSFGALAVIDKRNGQFSKVKKSSSLAHQVPGKHIFALLQSTGETQFKRD